MESSNFGFAAIPVLSDVPGSALISSWDGLVGFWVVNAGACGEAFAICCGALFESEKPHCGQNVACLRNSVLHRGQRVGKTDAT